MNKRAFALGAAMVLIANLAAVALRAFAEATFLAAYGPAQAPWLLIATAVGFGVATISYDVITRRAHPSVVDLSLLVLLAIVSAGSPALLRAGVSPIAIVIAVTAVAQVANLALWNRVAAAVAGRDARRMLPRAGAAITLGGAIAGLGTAAVVTRMGLPFIAYVSAGATAVVIALCIAQERELVRTGAPGGVPGGPGMPRGAIGAASGSATPTVGAAPNSRPPAGSATPTVGAAPNSRPPAVGSATPSSAGAPASVGLTTIQEKLLAAIVAVAALEAIVTTVIDLQFLATVKSRYSGTTLAVALSLFYGGTNAILFVLQALAMPRILVTRSLPFTAALHPLVVILAYLGYAASPGFIAIAGTRTSDQVLRLATSRTSQELAFSALPPGPRARWKVLVRGVIYPAGAASAGYVLFLIGPRLLHTPSTIAAIAIGVAIIWGITARVAARRFQHALAAPLNIKQARREDPRRIPLDTLEAWTHAAGSDDARAAALARIALHRARVDAEDLADHLRHDEPDVRAALFDQLVRSPVPSLRGELRAAIAIEDEDRPLALGIKALAIAGDDSGVARGKARAGLSRAIDEVTRAAEQFTKGAALDRATILEALVDDPVWAVALLRQMKQRAGSRASSAGTSSSGSPSTVRPSVTSTGAAVDDTDKLLLDAYESAPTRAGACFAIVRVGDAASLAVLAAALEQGEPAALAAIASLGELDGDDAAAIHAAVPGWSAIARATTARALAGASSTKLLEPLIADRDPEVAHAALRTALAHARSGIAISPSTITAAHDAALAALAAHLDARDALGAAHTACQKAELEIATRRCVARLLWVSAVEAAAAGRDPAPIAATARRLVSGSEADRKRALDIMQELAARASILAALERWLRPPAAGSAIALGGHDAWLAKLLAGELSDLEPALVALRRPPLFASIAGPALADLASHTDAQTVDGKLFDLGAPGDTMFIVTRGTLIATRDGTDRRIEAGAVVGELAVLTQAPRAATVTAAPGGADVLVIDRAAFTAASRRAPELVLGLSSTLAGWLAPNRPDVL
ncbi:MAG: cyclic nucleotide-binding domain-containing protein [Kofleriaceae bacterium]